MIELRDLIDKKIWSINTLQFGISQELTLILHHASLLIIYDREECKKAIKRGGKKAKKNPLVLLPEFGYPIKYFLVLA